MSSLFRPPETFRTARLWGRPATPQDAPAALAAYAGDPEVTRYLSWPPYTDESSLAQFFEERALEWSGDREHFTWMLRRDEDAAPIGIIGCKYEQRKVVFGYALGRAAWGQGLAAEALRPLVEWSLAQPTVDRAWAFCDVENLRSTRVLEKAGMTREAVLRRWHSCPNLGPELRDCFIYARVK